MALFRSEASTRPPRLRPLALVMLTAVAAWAGAAVPAGASPAPPAGVPFVAADPDVPLTAGTYEEAFTGQDLTEDGLSPVVQLGPRTRDAAAGGAFECTTHPHQYVSSYPAGLVIGNCSSGWRLNRTRKSDPVAPKNNYWEGGYVYGEFNGCGWLRAQWSRLTAAGRFTACGSPSRGTSSFASALNCDPGPGCNDGTLLLSPTVAECPEYLNVRPWSTTSGPRSGPVRVRPTGYTGLKWRYITADGDWVMVRDVEVAEGQGNWVFVPRSCIRL